jgi:hypothetical protein
MKMETLPVGLNLHLPQEMVTTLLCTGAGVRIVSAKTNQTAYNLDIGYSKLRNVNISYILTVIFICP